MNERKAAVRAARDKTLSTLTPLDEHISLLDYHCDYDLDRVLAAGISSSFGLARSIQKIIRTPRLMKNPMAGHGGCSTFNIRNPEGQVLMGRNFDYKDANCLVVWTHPKEGYRSMGICNQNHMLYADVRKSRRPMRTLGAPYVTMDGVNEKGLCCAILELLTKPTKQKRGNTPITTVVAVRAILDKCATVDEAIALMDKYDMHDLLGAAYHYFLTDASNNSAIVEYVGGKMYVYRQTKPDESMKLTNFFITPEGKCREKGRDRYEKIECTLGEKPVMTDTEAMELLSAVSVYFRSKYKVYMISTSWSAVYNCTERSMLLCAGRDYGRKYRLSLDEPLKAVPVEEKGEV